MSVSLGRAVARVVRRYGVGRMLLDEFPRRVVFQNQVAYQVPRSVWRTWKVWRKVCRAEMESVYAIYDGGDFIDVGAFHGFYSLLLGPKGHAGSTFLSLEPDRRALPSLLSNLSVASKLFPNINFVAVSAAAGDGGDLEIRYPTGTQGHPAFSSHASGQETDAPHTKALDSLVSVFRLRPSLVKIDVEGAEYGVLRGMASTLKEHGPSLMLEIHPEWQPAGVIVQMIEDLLGASSYRIRVITKETSVTRTICQRTD
jgi:FkbM family methyltransferase